MTYFAEVSIALKGAIEYVPLLCGDGRKKERLENAIKTHGILSLIEYGNQVNVKSTQNCHQHRSVSVFV